MANTKKANAKVAKATNAAAVEAGPRGFRFGATYIQSVIEGTGVAMKEANRNKLIAFANELGVAGINAKTDIQAALKSMKVPAKKYLHQHYEVA